MVDTIFSSEIFQNLFMKNPQMEALALEKVVPIAGDLIVEGLGIELEQRKILVNELDVIINCAASVNFDDPLLDAIQINYIGCLRMVELA
jgi:thioester reductase-like protein